MFELDPWYMNTFELVQCLKNNVRDCSMFDEMVFDPSLNKTYIRLYFELTMKTLNWESTKCTHLLWTNFIFCRFLKKRYLVPFRPEFQTPWRVDVASIHPTCKTPECQGVKHSLVKVVVSQGGGKLQQPGIFLLCPPSFFVFSLLSEDFPGEKMPNNKSDKLECCRR